MPNASQPTVHRFADMPVDQPMALIDRRRVLGAHSTIAHVTLHEGFSLDTHHHESEQFAIVLSGCVRFTVASADGRAETNIDVRAGEMLHIPPNAPHAAKALETSVVIDVFSPPADRTGVDRA